MASQGRCYFARAGRLDESLAYAARAREAGDIFDDARLRAWCAMEAEPYLYKGLWDEVIRVAEEALPAAWKTGEWEVVLWSSAWAATAYLKLGQPAEARRILDKALKEVPARPGARLVAAGSSTPRDRGRPPSPRAGPRGHGGSG
jgi:tetratricopeptide (TPR) repeat protein